MRFIWSFPSAYQEKSKNNYNIEGCLSESVLLEKENHENLEESFQQHQKYKIPGKSVFSAEVFNKNFKAIWNFYPFFFGLLRGRYRLVFLEFLALEDVFYSVCIENTLQGQSM